MKYFTKILFVTFGFISQIYSICVPQNVDMNIPYQQQNISVEYNPTSVVQQNGLLHLILTQSGGTRIRLDNKIQYGRIDVTMKVAYGNSIVSAFVLYSDETQDEVDFEFVQNKDYPNRNIQTTFYYRGIPLYNVNDLYIDTGIELAYSFNKYTFIWDVNFYEWRFNDIFLRRTYRNETANYPDSLSYVKISIWEHVPSKWSGPAPNWRDAPFILLISSIKVSCFENSTTLPTQQTTTTTTLPTQQQTATTLPIQQPTTTLPTQQTTTTLPTQQTTTTIPTQQTTTTTTLPTQQQTTTITIQTQQQIIEEQKIRNNSNFFIVNTFLLVIAFINSFFI